GMQLAQKALRDGIKEKAQILADKGCAEAKTWIDTFNIGAENGPATEALLKAIESDSSEEAKYIKDHKDFVAKKSQWIIGGDGWAYDIGFGGVDHALASGQDINILVLNTEVYSNTGGQASKATPTGAVAQFAAGGKEVKQKDLASIAMSYGYVYVAQIAMGANMAQTIKAISEAEAYPGPSLIICYAPCINQGLKVGMSKVMDEEKKAVETGYWHLFRFNPDAEGSKFTMDSKAPTAEYSDFLAGEVRYTSLKLKNAERAAELFAKAEKNAKERFAYLEKLNQLYS
nr:pyruvate:ferredoxin (flavodoxin) oxidoreductase [Lachnospiraceae bacterium]